MKVSIDLVADAASLVWGERTGGSTGVDVPGRGVRLMLSAAGDVVGVEVLGWSQRATDPSDVVVRITGVADVLDDDDPLAMALAASAAPVTTRDGRPADDSGQPMVSVREAAARIGKDRSWITRQLNSGTLRGRKIGNEWWTTDQWIEDYLHARTTRLGA